MHYFEILHTHMHEASLFYEDWNNETSNLLLSCDDEVQKMCLKLKQFDLSFVKSLKIHYGATSSEEMTKKISGIAGFKGLISPVISVDGGFVPNFDSRYFTADFSYGLAILVQIAELIAVKTPNMKNALEWYYGLVDKRDEFVLNNYVIGTK